MNINEFYKNIKKKYPNTREVLEQLDEIKDMLNSKVQNYVKNGMKYEEASSKAINELGNIDELFDDISKDAKIVHNLYIKILTSLISSFSTAFLVFILGLIIENLSFFNEVTKIGYKLTMPYFYLILFIYIIIYTLWNFSDNIKPKIRKYSYDIYKINLKNSIIAVLIYSSIMLIINIITYKYNNYLWFIWAFNGILNWTISIIADYHLFRSSIFEYKK
ncbi:permease prefix domain 1-containing protein [uncultured Brachyspira sp.]|uniref:permease prefix domain 1-containing protein n=1 Tax=uncultured Brachyspira sp. TaxID=221953 RepID=UPI0026325D19|nr:permease prefix domain 1-containing protein [uncultured Brachyspira sp.]